MQRSSRAIKQFYRSIYIPTRKVKSRNAFQGPARDALNRQDEIVKRDMALLDTQLKEMRQQQRELQEKIRIARDRELQASIAQKENAKLEGEVSQDEILALERELKGIQPLTNNRPPSLPSSIQALLPSNVDGVSNPSGSSLRLFSSSQSVNWVAALANLPEIPVDMPQSDLEVFMNRIPLRQKADFAVKLDQIIPAELKSQFVKDQLMAGFAELGRVDDVKRIKLSCSDPTPFSYGHLAKALFKARSAPEEILAVVKEMDERGMEPNLPVMSNAIQSLIQHGRHAESQAIFDNMKYWSIESQPDRKLYNSMILSAAKQHNVNRCLDLLAEMKERRPHPIVPNEETYNYIVYACARDETTQQKAWELFLEACDRGFQANIQSFRALLYLAGKSGEVLLTRALIRSLSQTSPQFIDDFALNCLFLSYKAWQPGPSKLLSSPSGQSIRANIIMSAGNGKVVDKYTSSIPFLPLSNLDRKLIKLESNAVMEYFAETRPSALQVDNPASRSTTPVIYNFLQIAINLGDDISEFRRRFFRFTKFAGNESAKLLAPSQPEDSSSSSVALGNSEPEAPHPTFAINRDQYMYRLAIQAAIKFKDLEFGREIWTERGQWRKLEGFRCMSQAERNRHDFQFARDLVELLAVCGRVEEAVMLVKSSQNLHRWNRYHLKALFEVCESLEDTETSNFLLKLIKTSKQPKSV